MIRNSSHGIFDSSKMKNDEHLNPPFDSSQRKSGIVVCSFNLVASIVGGGVLSLPLSFKKAGIIPASIMMIGAAIMTEFSIYILCSAARRTGAKTFGEVCLHCFGTKMELFTSLLLFVFLSFVIVAYMVLVKSIWTPILEELFDSLLSVSNSTGYHHHFTNESQNNGNMVLLLILISVSPLLLKKDLHALRYNCYIGFASISVLCLAMLYRAIQKCETNNDESPASDILWVNTSSFQDVLFAFPIITLSFLATFNVPPVQSALIEPTRERVRDMIHISVLACFILMYIFGLSGYLFAREETQGIILENFKIGDNLIIVGRIGSGLTILMALPIIALPCRQSLLEFIKQLKEQQLEEKKDGPRNVDNVIVDESSNLIPKKNKQFDVEALSSPESTNTEATFLEQCISTFLIISGCYIFAISVPGVATVWSICGSSMGFLIAFILPSACYIKVRQRVLGWNHVRILSAWILLVFATISAIACTIQAIFLNG